ncbi:MAG TPA: metal-sulfur cluster assembly factor [Ktedonobacterales bacterium]
MSGATAKEPVGEAAGEMLGEGAAGETSLAPTPETAGRPASPFPRREEGQGVRHAEYPHDTLWDALRDVSDPEMGISLVDMGLVVAARLSGEIAQVTLTYTAMGCPGMQMIEDDVRERLLGLPGVGAVEIETVWTPVWTKARLTERGRDELLLSGLAL